MDEGDDEEPTDDGDGPTEPGAVAPDEPHPEATEAVGDGREKYVEVVTADGERHEHGDSYLRETEEVFVVSGDPEFAAGETTVYRKAELSMVSVEQHHSACFITTAVAGEEATLASLRGFRDDALAPSPLGRPLVAVYEAVSPPIAATLAANPEGRTANVVRRLVRRCAGLARQRDGADGVRAAALSTILVALYVVGVGFAAAGHLATVATAGRRTDGVENRE